MTMKQQKKTVSRQDKRNNNKLIEIFDAYLKEKICNDCFLKFNQINISMARMIIYINFTNSVIFTISNN